MLIEKPKLPIRYYNVDYSLDRRRYEVFYRVGFIKRDWELSYGEKQYNYSTIEEAKAKVKELNNELSALLLKYTEIMEKKNG